MILLAAVILLNGAHIVGSMPGGPGVPENITVTFLNPTSVRVSWSTSVDNVYKYDVTYKPTDASYRVVAVVAGNSQAVTLSGLKADTQYQLTVAAVWGGKRYRSRPIVFRTLEPPRTSPQQDIMGVFATGVPSSPTNPEPPDFEYPQTSSTVRGVEIGIVLLVLVVWIGAIALFFNRWGKIRMLLPYQPDYKEQLKVPGTAACAAAVASGNTCSHNSGDHMCSQKCRAEKEVKIQSPHHQRSRTNSAIFISNSGPGFDSKEFMRRYGSISKLCRRARSVDNLSLEEEGHFGLPTLSISGPSPPGEDEPSETERFLQ
ncbi:hypothetical protein PPYR_11742 [Photinus pyralis]|uniref:Fibronectin type-III domain-containing protein n=1 Tax=Photinus pyralis TaxID=7054 RepID=A0A1Y1KEX2_PHOPY|nr:fibronectin type III domain-containing protein 5 isoform X1 [Photinus pyralis]XP_031349319.1 fibronectin type III domain-containing protein 5 isoform X1 [Photinus pyralis]KAB0794903.1 hypothetical protein PPYR_11742 [Photinus pyralis]